MSASDTESSVEDLAHGSDPEVKTKAKAALSPKEIVLLLCGKPLKVFDKVVQSNKGKQTKLHQTYLCPRENCTLPQRHIDVQSNQYSNVYRHLQRCYGGDRGRHLLQAAIDSAQKEAKGNPGKITSFCDYSLTPQLCEMIQWVKLVVLEDLPIRTVEKDSFRRFGKMQCKFSAKTFKSLLDELVKLVEGILKKEMVAAKHGAIIHDAWTKGGIHYVGLMTCFIKTSNLKRPPGGNEKKRKMFHEEGAVNSEVVYALLSVAPIGIYEEEEEDDQHFDDRLQTISLTTRATDYQNHIKDVFASYYGLDVKQWALAIIADNAAVNKKLASLLRIPDVACKSHLLNLQAERMVKQNTNMNEVIESVHKTLAGFRNSYKNRAVLSEYTELAPLVRNETRWSGKYDELKRFLRIHAELREAFLSENSSGSLTMDVSTGFKAKAEKARKALEKMNDITVSLQKPGRPLWECQSMLDVLYAYFQVRKDDPKFEHHILILTSCTITSRKKRMIHITFFKTTTMTITTLQHRRVW